MSDGEAMFWLLVIMVIYFIPAITAVMLKNRQAAAIFALNSLLGWTLVGWCVALIWAFIVTNPKEST
jgi:putative effector of murein hydrolase LrgA (UPF0299 family)